MENDAMAGILDGLNIAKLSLSAQQFAMTVAQRNTVNVNNPNYTRQDVFFTDLTVLSNWTTNGVPGVDLSAQRNYYLDKSISYGFSTLGENTVKYNALLEIDAILQGTSGGGLGSHIDAFFNSFTALSSSPADSALRWQVLSTAKTMTQEFSRIYNQIQSVQTSANNHIKDGVNNVNTLTAKIADLNGRIETAQSLGQLETEYALRDERQQYIEELENKIGVLYFETFNTTTNTNSITITTTQGEALVLGKTSMKLEFTDRTGEPFPGIFINGNDITSTVTSGEIGGYLQVRDTLIPGYLDTLDAMATAIASEVNNVHVLGYGLDGTTTGLDFFSFDTTSPTASAARSLKVIVAADDIAASAASGEIGDNTHAKALAAIGVEKLTLMFKDGSTKDITLSDAYASLLYNVGSDQLTAKDTALNQQSILNQLMGQRDSASGVSLNEEAINLIKYQRAYQASSSIVSILNNLSYEILNFVR
jgi:flagellar hook-associated protein 1 FlgK